MKSKNNKTEPPRAVGSSDVLDRIVEVTAVTALIIGVLFFITIIIWSIKEKRIHLDCIPNHRQTQTNPHRADAASLMLGKVVRLCDWPLSSITHAFDLEPWLVENLDGLVSETKHSNSAQYNAERGDVFGAHNVMRSNDQELSHRRLVTLTA